MARAEPCASGRRARRGSRGRGLATPRRSPVRRTRGEPLQRRVRTQARRTRGSVRGRRQQKESAGDDLGEFYSHGSCPEFLDPQLLSKLGTETCGCCLDVLAHDDSLLPPSQADAPHSVVQLSEEDPKPDVCLGLADRAAVRSSACVDRSPSIPSATAPGAPGGSGGGGPENPRPLPPAMICSTSPAALTDLIGGINVCNHLFHHDCIQQWARLETSCPLCKQIFGLIVAYRASDGHKVDETICLPTFQADNQTSDEEDEEEEEEDEGRLERRQTHRQMTSATQILRARRSHVPIHTSRRTEASGRPPGFQGEDEMRHLLQQQRRSRRAALQDGLAVGALEEAATGLAARLPPGCRVNATPQQVSSF
eukprot:GHVT01060926.1.p1 GENE.GHVT01060926.1~~GHVT01060926.1.p1  ORF type:complete len:367 (-),score=60.62 GHVT01060926.1:146-1246(-)